MAAASDGGEWIESAALNIGNEADNSTFDTSLPGRHAYLGDIDDVGGGCFLEDGTILTIPMFYLEGVVLIPGRVLPLRVLQSRFKLAIERAVHHSEAKAIGVTHVRAKTDGPGVQVFVTGTTAEIRQLRYYPDGSLNVLTRGRQRFRLCRAWTEADGSPCAQVQILDKEKLFYTPREAFGSLASVPHNECVCYPTSDDQNSDPGRTLTGAWAANEGKWLRRAQRSYWPHWVYKNFDAFGLARQVADLYTCKVRTPSIECFRVDPVGLSYFIAAEAPLSDVARQELLEVDEVGERLRKEIDILKRLDWLRCKVCQDLIAKHTTILTMSTDGPVATFVNPYGFVYETLTVSEAQNMILQGEPKTENSWFPGYSWVLCYCKCGLHIGWYFRAINSDMQPQSFWGVRRCQIGDY